MAAGEAGLDRDLHLRRLEAFVLRARRVEAHSLVSDRPFVERLARVEWRVSVTAEGTVLERELPPEELVESAAARVRPLLLAGEDCYYNNVLNSIGALVDAPEVRSQIKPIRAEWRARVEPPNGPGEHGWTSMAHDSKTGRSQALDHIRQARAWIYGDVVHHDEAHRARADMLGVTERYRAAVPLVAFTMLAAVNLLEWLRSMQSDALLQLPSQVFHEPVIADTATAERKSVTVYLAPLATTPPGSATDPLSSDWRRLTFQSFSSAPSPETAEPEHSPDSERNGP